jgi:deoxycytidylate deaminase
VIQDLADKPKPHTIAVDQIPCSGCAPVIKDADIDKVVVPQTLGNPGSPKTAAVKGAKGKNKVEPKELNEDLK